MILLTNSVDQVIPVGGSATFDMVVERTGCDECRKHSSSSIKLCRKGTYTVSFGGNISVAAAGGIGQLSIALGGEPLLGSNMVNTSTNANERGNVSKTLPVNVGCCDFNRVSIVNTGANTLTLYAGPSLAVW